MLKMPDDIKGLVEEARAIQAQFLDYERSHTAKGTPEGAEKAATNRRWAARGGRLADALSVLSPTEPVSEADVERATQAALEAASR